MMTRSLSRRHLLGTTALLLSGASLFGTTARAASRKRNSVPAPAALRRVVRKRSPHPAFALSATNPYFTPVGSALNQNEQDEYQRARRAVRDIDVQNQRGNNQQ